jgi:hypothetical protein
VKVLKTIGLAILGFLLFLALSVLGVALMVNSTVLNPRFLPGELDRLQVGALVAETVDSTDVGLTPQMQAAVVRTVTALEPRIKAQLRTASGRVYAYLLGDVPAIDLTAVLKDTLLAPDFVDSVVNDPEIVALARQDLRDQIAALMPPSQPQLVRYLDTAMPSVDPWLTQQLNAAAGPVVDYLLGSSPTLQVVIPLDPMQAVLRPNLRAAFLRSPPPELAGANSAQLDSVFNQYYEAVAAQFPPTATIDPVSLGLGHSASLAQTLADADAALADARIAIGYFRRYYFLLMVVVALLILGIAVIHREVRGAARDLGITFLTYGALEFLGLLAGSYFLRAVNVSGLPAALQSWLPGLFADFIRPLQLFSLVVAVTGLALVIVSLLYRRRPTV